MAYGDLPYGSGGYKGIAVAPPAPVGTSSRYYFSFFPNWRARVKITYGFHTAMSTARKLGEQRRALYDRARRTMTVEVLESKDTPTVQNFLEANNAETIYVPIFNEPIIITGPAALQAQTHFDCNSLADYFNLQELTEYIMLIDLLGELDAEVLEYANHTETTLNTGSVVNQAYTPARAAMYPAMPAFVETKRMVDETDDIVVYSVTFREYY